MGPLCAFFQYWLPGILRQLSVTLLSLEKAKRKSNPKKPFCAKYYFVCKKHVFVRHTFLCTFTPLICIQILFDVFQSGWPCKLVRYVNLIFPAITVNNLVVISLEKYLSTRANPHTFSTGTVHKMIIFAWVFGLFFMLFPAAAYDGIRVDLNDTHFTVVCRNDPNFYAFKIILVVFPVQYLLPGIFITYINICLMKTVWVRGNRNVGNGPLNNAFKAKMRVVRIRGISLLITITFTFIITYFVFLGYQIAYTLLDNSNRDFSTDFIIRYASGSIAYLNCVTDVIIYFVQMKDFREFLRKRLCRSGSGD